MKAKEAREELRQKSTDELSGLARDLREELFRLRMKHYVGQLDKVTRLGATKRQIARVATILGERQRGTR